LFPHPATFHFAPFKDASDWAGDGFFSVESRHYAANPTKKCSQRYFRVRVPLSE
jgi:hypothetical protein